MFGRMLCIAMLTATMGYAQRGGGGGAAGNDAAGRGGGMARAAKLSKAEMFANQLSLSKEQREEAQKILNDTMKEVALQRAQIEQIRIQIVTFMINGDSQENIKKATESLAAAETRLTGIEAKSFARVCELLKPNQQSKAAAAFDLWAAVLDPPGSAGPGGFSARGKTEKE
ncbi:MAG: hypothetical protein LAP85_25085 [Acidobacteriia bacterium]|nr:hypothetical protein [Terriglobia bacterium]